MAHHIFKKTKSLIPFSSILLAYLSAFFVAFFCFTICYTCKIQAQEKEFEEKPEDLHLPSKIYLGEFSKIWKAVQRASRNYEYSQKDDQLGFIQTRWRDNTFNENEILDEDEDPVASSKIQLFIYVRKGRWKNQDAAKVIIFKKQRVGSDVAIEGDEDSNFITTNWEVVPSDGIQEKVFFYRVRRLLSLDNMWLKEKKTGELPGKGRLKN